MPGEERVYDQFPPASWTPSGGRTIYFPVERVEESGGNRLVPRERAYKNGAKVDNTGSKATTWRLLCDFTNTLDEPGVENGGDPLYPTVMLLLLDSCASMETGDLVIPTRGKKRAQAQSWTTIENKDPLDTGIVTLEFMEDNEDETDVTSLKMPSVNATAIRLASNVSDAAESFGVHSASLMSFTQALAALESIANAPSTYARDVQDHASTVLASGNRLKNSFTAGAKVDAQSGDFFNTTKGNRAERLVVLGQDRAGLARMNSGNGRSKGRVVVFENSMTMAAISSMTGADVGALIDANPRLDPTFVPRGTQVTIPNGKAG